MSIIAVLGCLGAFLALLIVASALYNNYKCRMEAPEVKAEIEIKAWLSGCGFRSIKYLTPKDTFFMYLTDQIKINEEIIASENARVWCQVISKAHHMLGVTAIGIEGDDGTRIRVTTDVVRLPMTRISFAEMSGTESVAFRTSIKNRRRNP